RRFAAFALLQCHGTFSAWRCRPFFQQSSAREVLRAALPRACRAAGGWLADLDEVAVPVPHAAADLRSPVDRWRDKLSALRLPFLVAGLDVSDPQVQEDRGGVAGLAPCCARAQSGHAAAMPPRREINSRRFSYI